MNTEYYWRSLPHFHPLGKVFSITTLLADAVPKASLIKLQHKHQDAIESIRREDDSNAKQLLFEAHQNYQNDLEELLHKKQTQEFLLGKSSIAQLVFNKVLELEPALYSCRAMTIMPNHIHLLLDLSIQIPEDFTGLEMPVNYHNLDKIMKRIKGSTAYSINKLLNRKGPVWRPGYYNRYIRTERHFWAEYNYILQNPVKAGFVKTWEDHPFTYGGRINN